MMLICHLRPISSMALQNHRNEKLSAWRDCIVILMDLIGIKKRALTGDSQASAMMRSFHRLVHHEMGRGCPALHHAYVWNDSVLLLAYVNNQRGLYEKAMRDADDLKRKVDLLAPSYAIAVKGQTFPQHTDFENSRVTVIKASSYAMANCFEIEAEAKKKKISNRYWYIDARIAKKVQQAWAKESIKVRLLPGGNVRKVCVHVGYLWGNR